VYFHLVAGRICLVRIFQMKTSASRGGAETLLLDLSRAFVERGHSVITVLGEDGWLVRQLEKEGLAVCGRPLNSWRGFFQVPGLVSLLRDEAPDVVLAHGARVNLFGTLAAGMSGIPCVAVEHGVEPWRESSPLRNLVDRCLARRNRLRIAVSRAVAEHLVTKRILSASQVEVIPNGVAFPDHFPDETERLEIRRRFGLTDGDFVVVTAARLSGVKGHRYLLDAIPRLLNSHPELKFLWLGEGPSGAELAQEIEKRGLTDKVIMAGVVDNVPSLLPAFDIFVLPSLGEGMPIAIIEAMGMGLPVIATCVAGTPEVIADAKTGILVPPRDGRALGAAILRLVENPVLRENLAEAGKSLARCRFGIGNVADRYLDLLRDVCRAGSVGH